MAERATLARPYAKAVFEVALDSNALADWQRMLNTAAAVVSDSKVQAFLATPTTTAEQQAALVKDVCGDELDAKAANLVRVLATNKRLPLLPEIASQFGELKARRERVIGVEIASAFPLEAKTADVLSAALSKKWQCNVALQTTVDAALLGGVVIKAEDIVIDASVRGRMLKLADALMA
ncbi:MAG: F0F1 ATP synthase subunit delta [Pseudomonadales bacterium]|jgi:F-type H+-transporting ATPase subunit delta